MTGKMTGSDGKTTTEVTILGMENDKGLQKVVDDACSRPGW